jgi:hypothetical protein
MPNKRTNEQRNIHKILGAVLLAQPLGVCGCIVLCIAQGNSTAARSVRAVSLSADNEVLPHGKKSEKRLTDLQMNKDDGPFVFCVLRVKIDVRGSISLLI